VVKQKDSKASEYKKKHSNISAFVGKNVDGFALKLSLNQLSTATAVRRKNEKTVVPPAALRTSGNSGGWSVKPKVVLTSCVLPNASTLHQEGN
jgi:hypothetical protein